MNYLESFFAYISELTKLYPVLGGAISVALGGGVIGALWKFPPQIIKFIQKYVFVTFSFDNSGYGPKKELFFNFMQWFQTAGHFTLTRSMSFNGNWYNGGTIGPGSGKHVIIVNKKIYFVEIVKLASEGSDEEKIEVIIRRLGFSFNPLYDIYNEFSIKDPADERRLWTWGKGDTAVWVKSPRPIPNRSEKSVILDRAIKTELIERITEFKAERQWYKDRGIPYKLVIVLYGPPGTGKTSIIKMLSTHFNMSLATMNMMDMSDRTFPAALESAPSNSIISAEDFDGAVEQRKSAVKAETPDTDKPYTPISLSTVLNSLDGIVELDGNIIFLTTNHIEKIDWALIRPGRMDMRVLIPYLSREVINEYVELMYPGESVDDLIKLDVPGCYLQELVIKNKRNFAGFKADFRQLMIDGITPIKETE